MHFAINEPRAKGTFCNIFSLKIHTAGGKIKKIQNKRDVLENPKEVGIVDNFNNKLRPRCL